MAANLSKPDANYSNYMASKDTSDLAFVGAHQQKSESITRSYGANTGLVGQLNQQNLGGLGGGIGRVGSDLGSLYRG